MKNIFYLIAVVIGLMFARTVCASETMQMAMNLKPDGEVRILLAGYRKATIDWGDGSACETHELSPCFDEQIKRSSSAYYHAYYSKATHTIIITGENITHIECNNTSLTYLDCSFNKLKDLNVNNNTALIELICWRNKLKSLDVSKNTKLEYLDCDENQLSTAVRKALFETLHSNPILGKMLSIRNNPETDTCNWMVAVSKGWAVNYSIRGKEEKIVPIIMPAENNNQK